MSPPDDLIIVDYAFKVNTGTEFIYLFLCPSGHGETAAGLRWTGHRPQTKKLRIFTISINQIYK
ncbi:hypothetical protein, partial [Escherichia coli]|uniref:hypothetical protein n=1 Tax=Escherichia coli TaxID=562 RepID=UPI001BE877E0